MIILSNLFKGMYEIFKNVQGGRKKGWEPLFKNV